MIALSMALALLLPAQNVAARQTTSTPGADELRARLDELRPRRQAALEAARVREARDAALHRSAAAAVSSVDTINVGMMRIVTPIDQVELARGFFEEVWEEHFSDIHTSEELLRAWFSFRWSEQRDPIYLSDHARPIELNSRWILRSRVKQSIRHAIASTLNDDLIGSGAAVGAWVSGNAFLAPSHERVYRMIATAESRSTRACLEGMIAECISGLGLTLPNPPRLDESTNDAAFDAQLTRHERARRQLIAQWYTPDERRAIVARTMVDRLTRGTLDPWRDCVDGGETATCDDLLIREDLDRAPMVAPIRESFVAYAVAQGGPGAWERLFEEPAMTSIEALEHASRQPIRDLATGWRDAILAHRPEAFARLIPNSALAIVWFLVFSAFALRSTRWRMG